MLDGRNQDQFKNAHELTNQYQNNDVAPHDGASTDGGSLISDNLVFDDLATDNIISGNMKRRAQAEVLEDEIITMAARLNAANYHMLKMLYEFDELDGWHGDGIRSFAHWLNWKIGMGYMMAREKVRVARALPDLPMIDKAFSNGALSYSKVRAMTRIATPRNELFLLQIAEHGTAAHMEQMVKKYALCKRLENPALDDDWKREVSVNWFQDDDGMYVINARLSPEEGAIVLKALEIEVDEIKRAEHSIAADKGGKSHVGTIREEVGADSGEKRNPILNNEAESAIGVCDENPTVKVNSKNVSAETFSDSASLKEDLMTVRARAISHIAETYLAATSGPGANDRKPNQNRSLSDKYQVFLHINANTASESHRLFGEPTCHAEQKQFIAPTVARRLACDASVTTVLEDDHSNVLNIGRKSRSIPRAIKHALRIRDNGCRFPGCHQKLYTDAHHIQHWMDGGETSLDNLVTLCRFHHTQLHKGAFTLHAHSGCTQQNSKHHDQSQSPNKSFPTIVFRNKLHQVIETALYPQFPPHPQSPEQVALTLTDSLAIETIDKHTAECKWAGDAMDYSLALQALSAMDGNA